MKKRILLTTMVILLIISAVLTLVSCEAEKDDDDDSVIIEDPVWEHEPVYDFKGYTVKFAVCEGETEDSLSKRSIMPDENSGDSVDYAVLCRNKAIEQRYNCNIDMTYYISDVKTSLTSEILSGSDEYDVLVGRQYDDISLCLDNHLIDIANHEDAAPYIDLDSEFQYWAQEYIKGLSHNGRVYWLTGDIYLGYTGGFYCTFVNTAIYEDVLKSREGSIYDIVRNKEWTVDKMRMFSDAVTTVKDISIDKLIGSEGVIGVAMPIHHNANALAVSSGVKFCDIDEDGNLYCPITDVDRPLSDFFTKYFELIDSDGVINFDAKFAKAFEAFKCDNALMVNGYMHQAELYLKDMISDYYVIPTPMLNEEQGRYISSLRSSVNLFGISANSKNVKATAIVLEAMCKESYRSVRPEYYDNALKFKYTSDIDAAAMIDLISESAYTDIVLAFAYTHYFENLGNMIMMELGRTERNMMYVMSSFGYAESYRNRHLREIVAKLSGEE